MICCHEDARTAYQWVLEHGPDGEPSPSGKQPQLFVAGDSAGGNLTLSVIAWARDQGLPAAKGAIAFAPLTDSTMSSPSWKANKETDPFLGPSIGKILIVPKLIMLLAMRFSRGKPPNHPEISPLLDDLSGLPPVLIQASSDEMLYDDAVRYANKARAEGSQVILQVWPRLVHVFQAFPELPEADDALERAASFIKSAELN